MALFKGNDARISILTRFYQLNIDSSKEDGGELFAFWDQLYDINCPPQETSRELTLQEVREFMPKKVIDAAKQFQDFVRFVMDDLYNYGMVNIGALEQINNRLRYHTPFFAYFFDPLSLEEDTAVGFDAEKIRSRSQGDVLYVKGPFLNDKDLRGYYVPLSAITPDREDDDINGFIETKVIDALRDVIYTQKAVGKCLSCKSVFIISRPGKVYCSHRCAARVSIRQKRATKQKGRKIVD